MLPVCASANHVCMYSGCEAGTRSKQKNLYNVRLVFDLAASVQGNHSPTLRQGQVLSDLAGTLSKLELDHNLNFRDLAYVRFASENRPRAPGGGYIPSTRAAAATLRVSACFRARMLPPPKNHASRNQAKPEKVPDCTAATLTGCSSSTTPRKSRLPPAPLSPSLVQFLPLRRQRPTPPVRRYPRRVQLGVNPAPTPSPARRLMRSDWPVTRAEHGSSNKHAHTGSGCNLDLFAY